MVQKYKQDGDLMLKDIQEFTCTDLSRKENMNNHFQRDFIFVGQFHLNISFSFHEIFNLKIYYYLKPVSL